MRRKYRSTALMFGLALLAVTGTASPVVAAVLKVDSRGTDGPACGTSSMPCATLQAAIDKASVGSTIYVGPGYYEPASDPGDCFIDIDKRLIILSTYGADVTLLSAAGAFNAVCITADDVTFGRKHRGFTLIEADYGLSVSDVSRAKIGGNLAVANRGGGFLASGSGHTFTYNTALCNDGAGFLVETSDSTYSYNRALSNDGAGFGFEGDGPDQDNEVKYNLANHNDGPGFIFTDTTGGNEADRNIAAHNDYAGFELDGESHTVRRMIAIGNGDEGMLIGGGPHVVKESHIVDNNEHGITTEDEDGTLTHNNLHGNRYDDADLCQLENASGDPISAPFSFFGVPTPAPGVVCGGDPVMFVPFSATQLNTPLSWLPL